MIVCRYCGAEMIFAGADENGSMYVCPHDSDSAHKAAELAIRDANELLAYEVMQAKNRYSEALKDIEIAHILRLREIGLTAFRTNLEESDKKGSE